MDRFGNLIEHMILQLQLRSWSLAACIRRSCFWNLSISCCAQWNFVRVARKIHSRSPAAHRKGRKKFLRNISIDSVRRWKNRREQKHHRSVFNEESTWFLSLSLSLSRYCVRLEFEAIGSRGEKSISPRQEWRERLYTITRIPTIAICFHVRAVGDNESRRDGSWFRCEYFRCRAYTYRRAWARSPVHVGRGGFQ